MKANVGVYTLLKVDFQSFVHFILNIGIRN